MKSVYFIRHGLTAGNLEKRYIGRTDEPLCEAGVLQAKTLLELTHTAFNAVYVSPYARCRETAEILFPGYAPVVVVSLRECDFGVFEGKTANELAGDAAYERWLASGCTEAIPGGEDVDAFKLRCCRAFTEIIAALPDGACAAIVTHGGCIMAVLEYYVRPKRSFYQYHIPNCGWVSCDFDGNRLLITGGVLC